MSLDESLYLARLCQGTDSAVPRLAEGTELIGEYEGSGLKESGYLARRTDGQVLHLSRLLYLITEAIDGQRDFEQIAQVVSQEFGRRVSAGNVCFLVEQKLSPMGILAPEEEGETDESADEPPSRLDEPVLGLRYRVGLISPQDVNFITTPFLFLFRMPVMVFVLVALIALDVWLFFHGIVQGMQEIIYQPALVLAFFVLETVAMGWHECGHASACRFGGAKPGVVGAGIYIFWFVFYSDVTDSYRLGKVGRLRTDFGGIYFDIIFSLLVAGAYFLTGFEPLLVLVLFNQLNALEEFSPFLRFDGYYILSDLTGVPDLFKYIKPTLKSLIPGREAEESVIKALKPWVRMVISVWVLSVVPMLVLGFVMLIIYGPWALATAWDSFLMYYGQVSSAFKGGRIIESLLGLVNIGTLVVPVVGGFVIFAVILRRWCMAAWRWSEERTLPLRTGLVLGLATITSLLLFIYSYAGSPGSALSQVVTLALDLPQEETQQPEPLKSGVDHTGLGHSDGGNYELGYPENLESSSTAQGEANDGTYTVQPDDTLSQIATRLGASLDQVAKSNGITNPDKIYSGQTLHFQASEKDRVGVRDNPTANE